MKPEEIVDLILSRSLTHDTKIFVTLEKDVLKDLILLGFEMKNIQVERYDFFGSDPNFSISSGLRCFEGVTPMTTENIANMRSSSFGNGNGGGKSYYTGTGDGEGNKL